MSPLLPKVYRLILKKESRSIFLLNMKVKVVRLTTEESQAGLKYLSPLALRVTLRPSRKLT